MKEYYVNLDKWHDLKIREMDDGRCEVTFLEDGKRLFLPETWASIKDVEWEWGIEIAKEGRHSNVGL